MYEHVTDETATAKTDGQEEKEKISRLDEKAKEKLKNIIHTPILFLLLHPRVNALANRSEYGLAIDPLDSVFPN